MKKISIYCLITGFYALMFTACQSEGRSQLSLWYEQPADEWMKATPLGNGRLGAMVYGGMETETIALNEITMWSGQYDEHQEDPCGKEKLAEIRKLFFDGKLIEGNGLATKHLSGKPHSFGSHLPVGDLKLSFAKDAGPVTGYIRQLDIENAVATVSYQVGDTRYDREYICSNPDQVLVIKLSASKKGSISFDLGLDLLRAADIRSDNHDMVFSGQVSFPNLGPGGVNFIGKIRVMAQGGSVAGTGQVLKVTGADEAEIIVDIRTDYENAGYKELCNKTIEQASLKDYDRIRQDHIQDYSGLFSRVELDLGITETENTPTDIRWQQVKEGKTDPALDVLFFQYGRYLLISSSREDSPLPANLQGIWNDNLACNMGWTCDYHLDINTEQNYWPANVCNLHECNIPLFSYIESLSVHGEKTAQKVYGSPGWVAHTVANVWGYTAPGSGVNWGLFPTASAWIVSHMWSHYCYTQDIEFLKNEAYPVLKKAALFYLDYMVENPNNGYLMTGPSNSPENSFLFEGWELALSMMPASDRILVYELYQACIRSSEILNVDAGFRTQLEQALAKFPPLQIGKNGELQEWFEDFESAHPNHRHASHLLSLYPYSQVSVEQTPELSKAAEKVIVNKLNSEGWEDVEWSRANTVAFYARLKNGEKAHDNLQSLLKDLTRENLLTISPKGIAGAPWDIFILDGNTAATAAIAEMLIQSYNGYIELLPALPAEWHTGSFKGLCVNGGAEVDMEWKNSVVRKVTVRATADNEFGIKLSGTPSIRKNGNKESLTPDAKQVVTFNMKKGDYMELQY